MGVSLNTVPDELAWHQSYQFWVITSIIWLFPIFLNSCPTSCTYTLETSPSKHSFFNPRELFQPELYTEILSANSMQATQYESWPDQYQWSYPDHPSLLQCVQPMSMWGEVQMPVNLVQQWAPHLGVWSGCVLAWMVQEGSMNQTHHCHVWVSHHIWKLTLIPVALTHSEELTPDQPETHCLLS